ncbi:MAG: YcaO-like family protein [Candidatus Woesearchaeota archaeon]
MGLVETLERLRALEMTNPERPAPFISDEPKTPAYLTFPGNSAQNKYKWLEECYGQGYDPDDILARIKSIGEALERLSLYNPVGKATETRQYEAKAGMIDPALFRTHAEPSQQRLIEWETHARESPLRWWPVTSARDGTDYLIPAQLLFLSPEFDAEFPLRLERISTGAAFGELGTDRALTSGLMESVERHATMSTYLLDQEVTRILAPPVNVSEYATYLQRYELETHLFDVTQSNDIPTVMAIVLDRTGIGPAVNIGSRSSLEYTSATMGALLESVHCRRTARLMRFTHFPDELPGPDKIHSMDDRFYHWYTPDKIEELERWLKTGREIAFDKLPTKKLTLQESFNNVLADNADIYIADISLPEFIANGFETRKVVIPQYMPLYLDERAKATRCIIHGDIPTTTARGPHPFT